MAEWEVRASTQLPIADRDEWDGDEALENILDFYRDEEGNVDANLAPRGFLLYNADSDGNDQNDYKFPFADIVDGELTAITRGIEVADSFLQDADVGGRTQEEMEEVINEYRRRADDLEGPDEDEGDEDEGDEDEGEEDSATGPYVLRMDADTRRALEEGEGIQGSAFANELEEIMNDGRAPGDVDVKSLPWETANTTFRGANIKDVDVKNGVVTGYFANFETVDSDGDRFAQGAFADSIAQDGPAAENTRIKQLYQHDVRAILGVPNVLKEDDMGLYFETEVMDTSLGRDVLEMYRHDALEHSVGFVRMAEDTEGENDSVTLITQARLMEGSAVTWGANENTPFTGFKSFGEVRDYLARKARALRSLLREDLRDVRLEQLEIGLRQLEADLTTLDEKTFDGGETPTKEDAVEAIDFPPQVNFLKTDDDEEETYTFSLL
jgi:HK97 family phage prohead protease